jgi:hypothetical protein
MRNFEKHRMKGMYPARTKLYLELRGEKRRITEDMKRGIVAYKRGNVQEQADQEVIVQAADDNPNDIRGEDEMIQFGEDHWHEKSDFQKEQCHEKSDFGDSNSDSQKKGFDYEKYLWIGNGTKKINEGKGKEPKGKSSTKNTSKKSKAVKRKYTIQENESDNEE